MATTRKIEVAVGVALPPEDRTLRFPPVPYGLLLVGSGPLSTPSYGAEIARVRRQDVLGDLIH